MQKAGARWQDVHGDVSLHRYVLTEKTIYRLGVDKSQPLWAVLHKVKVKRATYDVYHRRSRGVPVTDKLYFGKLSVYKDVTRQRMEKVTIGLVDVREHPDKFFADDGIVLRPQSRMQQSSLSPRHPPKKPLPQCDGQASWRMTAPCSACFAHCPKKLWRSRWRYTNNKLTPQSRWQRKLKHPNLNSLSVRMLAFRRG